MSPVASIQSNASPKRPALDAGPITIRTAGSSGAHAAARHVAGDRDEVARTLA